MDRRPVDLFDDPPWSSEATSAEPLVRSPRPFLAVSSLFAGVLLLSMAFPWFTSSETPAWTPFSHWLNLGWFPGTQKWGYLVFAVGVVTALAAFLELVWPRKAWLIVLLALAIVLVFVTLMEAFAHLSVDPGPNLHADYGAWIGAPAAVLVCGGAGVAVYKAFCGPDDPPYPLKRGL